MMQCFGFLFTQHDGMFYHKVKYIRDFLSSVTNKKQAIYTKFSVQCYQKKEAI
jgi:hypothetical protein